MRPREPLTGPRWLDPHQAGKITDGSLQRYRKAVQPFAAWLSENNYDLSTAAEWDDVLAEYKHFKGPALTKANFEGMVAEPSRSASVTGHCWFCFAGLF